MTMISDMLSMRAGVFAGSRADAARKTTMSGHRRDQFEFRVFLAAAYPVFLIVACGKRVMRAQRDQMQHTQALRRSIFAEAKSAASAAIGYAFMG